MLYQTNALWCLIFQKLFLKTNSGQAWGMWPYVTQHLSAKQWHTVKSYIYVSRDYATRTYVNADVSYSAAPPSSGTKAAVIRGDATAAQ